MKLIFATNNFHKIKEIKSVLPSEFEITTLAEAGINIDIPEPYDTLEANAREKTRFIYELVKTNCFSEDTGLEIESLHGAPGVKSARYAGEERSDEKNIEKVLKKLAGCANRRAQFKTIICLIIKEEYYFFEGICSGIIAEEVFGKEGFGYDPIFIPQGAEKTFAEMSLIEKNKYSHRRKAMNKLVTFLSNL